MSKFGAKIAPSRVRDYDYFTCCSSVPEEELPEKFFLPIDEWAEVRDQGEYNACVSFALTTAQEANHCKQTGERKTWSPGYIYGNPLCRPNYSGEGMYTHDAIKGTMKSGYVEEKYFDILTEMPEMTEYVKERKDLAEMGERTQLKGYVNLNYALLAKKISAMKEALYVHKVPLIIASRRFFGGSHCVVVYGWDDTLEMRGYGKDDILFAFRNSWGTGYKNGGNWFVPISKIDEVYMPVYQDMELNFKDVKKSDWYYPEIRAAVFSGLVQGVNKLEFCPDSPMSRRDSAVILSRLMEKVEDAVNCYLKTAEQKGESAQIIQFSREEVGDFDDVSADDYAYPEIRAVCGCGIMIGSADHIFDPDRAVTRAEMATVAVRMYDKTLRTLDGFAREPKPGETKEFADVKKENWYYSTVEKAAEIGLMQGDEDGRFRPDETLTRAEAAAVFNRLFKAVDDIIGKPEEE